jgi:group I intron endonuclease
MFSDRIPIRYDEKQVGIYCIRNKANGKFYIGSSINCYHRIKAHHFARLKDNTHTNPHLQAAYNLHGKAAFEYFIIELCHPDHLFQREQFYIDTTGCLKGEIGYNCNQFADRVVLTPEQRKKISQAKLGKKRDPETKKKMWAAIQNWRKNATPEQIEAREIKRINALRAVLKRDPRTGRYLKNEH